jgi:very-short-patch-repair endonuclease
MANILTYEKSFASHQRAINWSNKNILKPNQVFKNSAKKFWFDCNNCNHEFYSTLSTITKGVWCPYCCQAAKKLCDQDSCSMCNNRSFASHPKAISWSSLNKISARQVSKGTNEKYWFDCDKCPHKFECSPGNIIGGKWCPYCSNQKLCTNENCQLCYQKSFASHEKAIYWNDKNELKPRDVFKCSNLKYIFNCIKCNHEFETILNSIVQEDIWCNYCSNNNLCNKEDCKVCFDKSFASHSGSSNWSNKNKTTPRKIFKYSNQHYLFDCNKCNHVYEATLSNIIQLNVGCNYCSSDKLCMKEECKSCYDKSFASYPKSQYWSSKNKLKPREVFKHCNKKFIFNCDKCKFEFSSILNNTVKGNWCPICPNKTESKLLDTLILKYPSLQHQFKPSWCISKETKKHYPFDYLIPEFNIIIELDGLQHFEQVSSWKTPEETKQRDLYKMKCANENKYSVIRLLQEDVYYDRNDWLTNVINAIELIIKEKKIQNIFICSNNEYNGYTK